MAHDLGGLVEIAGIALELHAERVPQGVGRDPLGDGSVSYESLEHEPDSESAETKITPCFCCAILRQEHRA